VTCDSVVGRGILGFLHLRWAAGGDGTGRAHARTV